MPRESQAGLTRRCGKITAILKKQYPQAATRLHHADPLQLLVATILAAQCTDDRVNKVTKELFARYRSAADFAAATQEELQEQVRTTGFFRNKAKNIRAACQRLVQAYGGQVPDTMDDLLSLPGVARKTANVVLGSAFGRNEGVVVDTHVIRLSGRLGFSKQTDPVKIEQDLMAIVPRGDWTVFSHLLIFHGRAVCTARKPRCGDCLINTLCPSAFKV
ncbi:MAG: endonuclease III [Phycisphaerae bacterium]|nr:endonuclease III [Phycisphaerae bacterium]